MIRFPARLVFVFFYYPRKTERGAIYSFAERLARAASFALLCSLPCLAADLELRYGALERLIS